MAKYRNISTGAVVDVRDDKVLGSEWEAVKATAPAKATSSKRGSAATSSK